MCTLTHVHAGTDNRTHQQTGTVTGVEYSIVTTVIHLSRVKSKVGGAYFACIALPHILTKRDLPETRAELTHNKGVIVSVFLSKTLGRSKLASRSKCPQEEVGNFGG